MVQQTSIQKNDNRVRFFKRIFKDSTINGELKRNTEFLVEDYTAANKIAANLSSSSKWIPYPFLVDHIKKIADEMRVQGEIFREKIIELGGQVPQVNLESREASERNHSGEEVRQNIRRLIMDMEEHSTRCDTLMHQKNMIADAGVVNLLNAVIVDMQRQKDELIDIVMRIS
jgi:hypothetical protein